jgi:hypothetical protein
MSTSQPDRIVCPNCGRSGPNKPELAGRRLRCKCGGVIEMPKIVEPEEEEPLQPEPVEEAPSDDALYDVKDEQAANRNVRRPPDVVAYRAQAEPEEPAEPPPPAYPSFRPKTYASDSGHEQSQLIKLVVIIALIAVVIGGSIFGIRMMRGSGPTSPQLGEDADIEAKMQDEYYKEIHAWFQEDSNRIMGPWTQSQALNQADRWQQMGAKQVLAFGSRMSLVAVIVLPDDPAKRKQLFDWQAQWHREHMQRVWTDVGQKYLMIRLGV